MPRYDKDLHPKMCGSEARKYKKNRVVYDPIAINARNGEIFFKSYYGKLLLKGNG
jgi:hypothetical protein